MDEQTISAMDIATAAVGKTLHDLHCSANENWCPAQAEMLDRLMIAMLQCRDYSEIKEADLKHFAEWLEEKCNGEE